MARPTPDPDVPRLPRGRGVKVGPAHIFRILMVAGMLVMILVMRRPCADAIGNFVAQFDTPDAGVTEPKAKDPYAGKYMSEEEFRKTLDQARDAGPSTPAPEN